MGGRAGQKFECIVMSLVIEQSIECDFLPVFRHGHRLAFLIT